MDGAAAATVVVVVGPEDVVVAVTTPPVPVTPWNDSAKDSDGKSTGGNKCVDFRCLCN